MRLIDIIERDPAPDPWQEGDNIPWHDPAFSARMLAEHLSQEHDAASRRLPKIEAHVDWIHQAVLDEQPTKVLDLGCGPGLYLERLAGHGHHGLGLDYSPASIEYARERAQTLGLDVSYRLADIRDTDYGHGYGLAMLLYGELNVFCPADARRILGKAAAALAPGGRLLLEPHTYDAVREMGERGRRWSSHARGLFSPRPYLLLTESLWHPEAGAVTHRYYVVDAQTGAVTRHAQTMQAYTRDDYQSLLAAAGFQAITVYPSLIGDRDESQAGLLAIVAVT
jgi:SAM-dependent methyltransferase